MEFGGTWRHRKFIFNSSEDISLWGHRKNIVHQMVHMLAYWIQQSSEMVFLGWPACGGSDIIKWINSPKDSLWHFWVKMKTLGGETY